MEKQIIFTETAHNFRKQTCSYFEKHMLKENVLADAWKSSIIQIRDSRWEKYFTHVLRPIKKYLYSQNQLIMSDNKSSTAYTNRENFINPISYVYIYIHIQIHKYALRVLPAETWLTVYRRLRVPGNRPIKKFFGRVPRPF